MDTSRRRALIRTAGEAVERSAALTRADRSHELRRGPSGIAAHLTDPEAALAALLEVIERDTVMVAWARQLRLIGLPAMTWGKEVMTLASRLSARDVLVGQCRLPLRDVVVVVAGLFDPGRQLCGFGAKAHGDLEQAVRGAVLEAVQLCELAESARDWEDVVLTDHPRSDIQRAKLWSTPGAYAVLRGWFESFEIRGTQAMSDESTLETRRPAAQLRALKDQLRSEGHDVHITDITGSLPTAAARLSWRVVDVACDGLQTLIDDELDPRWLTARLESATRRTGHPSLISEGAIFGFPHPVL